MTAEIWLAVQTIAVVLSGGIVATYTIETYRLRLIAEEQVALQVRPFIVLQPRGPEFQLQNIGNGAALNVFISTVIIDAARQIEIRFDPLIPVLAAGDAVEIRGESFVEGYSVGDFFVAHLDPQLASKNLAIKISYSDINFKQYEVVELVSPSELRVLHFSIAPSPENIR